MDPEKFWTNTLRENALLAKKVSNDEEHLLMLTRNIEFANYNTCFAGMNGTKVYKNIKRPRDLYKLPSDTPHGPIKIDKERMAKDVKRMKEWLTSNQKLTKQQ